MEPVSRRKALLLGASVFGAGVLGSLPYWLRSASGSAQEGSIARAFSQLREAGFSGVIHVEQAGQLIFQGASGEKALGAEMTLDAVFDCASVSKTYTAMAILSLAEEGKLSVDDTLSKLLEGTSSDKAGITIRQLLSHTAGIVDYIDGEGDYVPLSRDEAVARLMAAPLDFAPGTGHAYSNGGYNLLGAIAETRSGMTLDEVLNAKVFAPAGVSASLDFRKFSPERLASRPFPDGSWLSPADVSPPAGEPLWRLWGAGGVYIDAAGMAAVSRAFSEGRIVSPQLVEGAYSYRVREGGPESRSSATLAGVIYDTDRGDRLSYHNGGGLMSQADVRNYLDRDTIITAVANSRIPGAIRTSREAAEALFGPDFQVPVPPPPPGTPVPADHPARVLFDALITAATGSQADRKQFIAAQVTPGFVERRGGEEEAVRFFFSLGQMLARPRVVSVTDPGDGTFNYLVQPLEREQPSYDLINIRTQADGNKLRLDGMAAQRLG